LSGSFVSLGSGKLFSNPGTVRAGFLVGDVGGNFTTAKVKNGLSTAQVEVDVEVLSGHVLS
jgi:hypothetical protein